MQRTEYGPADTDYVVSAANYLEVSEFAVFQKAYAAWYGAMAPERQLEKVFALYLLKNKVPYWVRNYARSRAAEMTNITDRTAEYSKTANALLYFATVVAEYVLLASYLVMR